MAPSHGLGPRAEQKEENGLSTGIHLGLLPGSESVCDPLPHAPVAMASPPGWTILSTKVTKRFLPYEALSGIGYSDGKSN